MYFVRMTIVMGPAGTSNTASSNLGGPNSYDYAQSKPQTGLPILTIFG